MKPRAMQREVLFIFKFAAMMLYSISTAAQSTTSKFDAGFDKYSKQNFEGALSDFRDVIKGEEGNQSKSFQLINAFTYTGMCYYEMKNFKEALPYFKSATDIGGKEFSKPANYLGICYVELSNYTEAIKIFDELIRVNPENQLAFLWRGLAEIKSSDNRAGCSDLNKAATLGNPDASMLIKQYCK